MEAWLAELGKVIGSGGVAAIIVTTINALRERRKMGAETTRIIAEADATESDAALRILTDGTGSILDRYQAEVERLSRQHEAMSIELDRLRKDNVDMRGEAAATSRTMDRLREDLDDARAEITRLKDALFQADIREGELSKRLAIEQARAAALEAEVATLRERMAELEAKGGGS